MIITLKFNWEWENYYHHDKFNLYNNDYDNNSFQLNAQPMINFDYNLDSLVNHIVMMIIIIIML